MFRACRGHNGIKSVNDAFTGATDYLRLKIGIDRPESRDPEVVCQYVLEDFTKKELTTLDLCFDDIFNTLLNV